MKSIAYIKSTEYGYVITERLGEVVIQWQKCFATKKEALDRLKALGYYIK